MPKRPNITDIQDMILEYMKKEQDIIALELCNYRRQCFIKVTNSLKAEQQIVQERHGEVSFILSFIVDDIRHKLPVSIEIPEDHIFCARRNTR